MPVNRRRFARLQDHNENLGRLCIGAIHYQVVNMGRKAVMPGAGGGKDKLHWNV
jgi:hypothetical protein